MVNYTEKEVPFTRIIEHKHFEYGKQPMTIISREYSSEWKPGDEPYYPVNNDAAVEAMKPVLLIRNNERINAANRAVQALAQEKGAQYIDVNDPLKDEQGRLKAAYTIEGMHIKEAGYRAIYPAIKEYLISQECVK